MRFQDIRLVRYGNFENRILAFPRSGEAPDLHIIYGPNEAGKTTTLEAVNDFLFGFPHNKSQDYRFDANQLQVGAAIEDGSTTTIIFRKRGRSGTTLRDESNGLASEGLLAAMLRGQTRESFRLSWSLDHVRLRDGGKAIVDARNDIGQAIFAAGAGLGNVPGVIEELESDAGKIWGERAAAHRTYTQAERDYENANSRERAARVKPSDWRDANERLEGLNQEQETKEQLRRELQEKLRKIERIRRIAPAARQLEEISTNLTAFTGVHFLEAEEEAFDSAVIAIDEANRGRETAETLLTEERFLLASKTLDTATLEQAGTIASLSFRRVQAAEAIRDLTTVQAERDAKRKLTAELADEVGIGCDFTGDQMTSLPSRKVVAELKKLARTVDEKRAKRDTLASSRTDAEKTATRDAARLQSSPVVQGADRLQAAVNAAQKAGDLDESAQKAGAELQTSGSNLAKELVKLTPWAGDVAGLQTITQPPDSEIDGFRDRLEASKQDIDTFRRNSLEFHNQLSHLALQKDQLIATSTAVPVETLIGARAERNQDWTNIRATVLEGGALADAPNVVGTFERHVEAADKLADTRFENAEASAQHTALEQDIARRELDLQQSTANLEAAKITLGNERTTWFAMLVERGIPALEPPALRDWLKRRDSALDLHSAVERTTARVVEIRSKTEALTADLAAAAPPGAAAAELPATFATRLEVAQVALTALLQQAKDREKAKALADGAVEKLHDATKLLQDAEDALTDAETAWRSALAKADLAGVSDLAALDVYETLRSELSAAEDLATRIQRMTETGQAFTRDVDAIASKLELTNLSQDRFEILGVLESRLETAKVNKTSFDNCAATVETRETKLRETIATLKTEAARLNPLMNKARVEDKEALASAIADSRARRGLLATKSTLDSQILKEGDGLPHEVLWSEWKAANPEELASDAAEVSAEVNKLTSEITDISKKCGEVGKALEGMERGPDAAQAAAEAALARSEMDVQAEAYLLRRAQAVVLRWAVERHRREFQNPLLARAKTLFERLTLGRYVDLDVDDNRESHRILGVSAGHDRTVPVEAMSEGTVDQLYLSLRLAALEHSVGNGVALPFLADDLFINFDDDRTRAGLEVLAEVGRQTQILVFTHHLRVIELARDALGAQLSFHDLSAR